MSKIKNNEIPSIPNAKFTLENGNHVIFNKNWNSLVFLSKPIHKNVDKKKTRVEQLKVTFFICDLSFPLRKKRPQILIKSKKKY